MVNYTKIIGLAALALLVLNGKTIVAKIKSITNAAQVGKNLIVDVRNFSISPLGFNLVLVNQVKKSISVSKPIAEFFINGKSVAYSLPDEKQYTIEPMAQVSIPIRLKIRSTAYASFFKLLTANKSVTYSLYANGMFHKDTVKL